MQALLITSPIAFVESPCRYKPTLPVAYCECPQFVFVMFNFAKKLTRRDKCSPYSHIPYRHGDDVYGSAVSLPAMCAPRSTTSQSNYSNRTVDPACLQSPRLNSRLDPEAPGIGFPSSVDPRRHRDTQKPRSLAFYTLLGSEMAERLSNMERSDRRSNESMSSPVALPHKALALLGIEEASGFCMPTSPQPHEAFDSHEELVAPGSERSRDSYQSNGGRESSRRPLPERLFFRPESLCSSFTTTSGRTAGTSATSFTAVSPSVESMDHNGTLNSESTLKPDTITMLNLDDSDESDGEEAASHISSAESFEESWPEEDWRNGDLLEVLAGEELPEEESPRDFSGNSSRGVLRDFSGEALVENFSRGNLSEKNLSDENWPMVIRKTGELPDEIALRICEYFTTEVHHEDLDQEERDQRCPNCNIYALWSLSLVSRGWSKAANKMLYKILSLDFGYYSALTRGPDGKGVAPEFFPYTKCRGPNGKDLHTKTDVDAKLQLLYRTIWDSQGDIGQQIRGIKLPRRLFSITKYPLSAILQKCPNLEFVDHAVTSGCVDDLVLLLSGLKQMKKWSWKRELGVKYEQRKIRHKRMTVMAELKRSMNGPPLPIALEVFPLWTKLQHLELDNLRRMDIPEEFNFCALPALDSITLRNLIMVDRNNENKFLGRLPVLRRLKIDTCQFITAPRILAYLEQKGYLMTHLGLNNVMISVPMICELLGYTPAIAVFSVANSTPMSPTSCTPVLGDPLEIPDLGYLRRIYIDMLPLHESLAFLHHLIDNIEKAPLLERMRLGYDVSGGRPTDGKVERAWNRDPCIVDGEALLYVKLELKCKFYGVDLL